MVDNKAGIIITINSVIVSILISVLYMGSTTIKTNIEIDHIKFLIVSYVLSMTIAVISMLPYRYMGKGANCFFYSMKGTTFSVTFEKREYPVNFSLESLKDQLHPDNFFK